MSNFKHYLGLTVAQMAIAVNTVIAKHVVEVMPIPAYLFVRFAATTVVLSLVRYVMKQPAVAPEHPQGRLVRRDWCLLSGQALCAGVLFNWFMMLGLGMTTATSAGIVSSSFPAVLAVSSFWLLGERFGGSQVKGIFLAGLGILVISLDSNLYEGGNEVGSLLGDLLIFLAMFPEALYSIFAKLLHRRVTALFAAWVCNLGAAVMFLPFVFHDLAASWTALRDGEIIMLLGLATIASAAFYVLWGAALAHVPASTAALFGGVMPVGTALIAVLFLGEIMTVYSVAGIVLVLLSIYVGTRRSYV